MDLRPITTLSADPTVIGSFLNIINNISPVKYGDTVLIESSVSGPIEIKNRIKLEAPSPSNSLRINCITNPIILRECTLKISGWKSVNISGVIIEAGDNLVRERKRKRDKLKKKKEKIKKLEGSKIDCLTITDCQTVFIHNCEFYFAIDENCNFSEFNELKFNNNIVGLPLLNAELHNKEEHAYNMCVDTKASSVANVSNNVFLSALGRNPRVSGDGYVNFNNNIILNPGKNVLYDGTRDSIILNFVNNVIISGPNTQQGVLPIYLNSKRSAISLFNIWMDGKKLSKVEECVKVKGSGRIENVRFLSGAISSNTSTERTIIDDVLNKNGVGVTKESKMNTYLRTMNNQNFLNIPNELCLQTNKYKPIDHLAYIITSTGGQQK